MRLVRKFSFISTLVLAIVLSVCMLSSSVLATSSEDAMKNLTVYVYGKVSGKSYALEGGGSIQGSALFEGSATTGYDLIEGKFVQLSSKAQEQLVSDMASFSNAAITDDRARGVDESTVQLWWKQLQTKQGVGSKFMAEILKNTKPDFVTANKIYEPFAGPIGVAMGIGAILIMGLLGIVMIGDIAYITLPPFRMLVGGGESKGDKKSLIISHDAIYAVEQAEGGNSGGGESKQALGIYFKRRVFMLVLLGICLMYLISGNVYTLVGYILDLVSGFIGF